MLARDPAWSHLLDGSRHGLICSNSVLSRGMEELKPLIELESIVTAEVDHNRELWWMLLPRCFSRLCTLCSRHFLLCLLAWRLRLEWVEGSFDLKYDGYEGLVLMVTKQGRSWTCWSCVCGRHPFIASRSEVPLSISQCQINASLRDQPRPAVKDCTSTAPARCQQRVAQLSIVI